MIAFVSVIAACLALLRFVPVLGFALLWWVLMLAGSSIGETAESLADENRLYLALVGPAVALPWLFSIIRQGPARVGLGGDKRCRSAPFRYNHLSAASRLG